ncbi:NTF2-like N-terminal transpeptidase domain-containing protein [Gracilibacillus sp. JCM 18860]|uniref:NTF2-like N-terminal transpeptidase domain-containing protein n=1 Tax=Gracilibacillus sp. JCM 18860 TaxID=1306159 RepID=UPI000A5089E6
MKKFLFLGTILFTVLLIGCQEKEEVEPEERLQEYADHWMNQEYEKMYKMVAETEKEDFIDRYQKIYKDLEINKVDVSFDVPDTEEKEKNDEAETEVFPLKVSMESVAGPITFDTEVEMKKVVKEVEGEEKTDWLVNWNPGLIFPEIKDGGAQ